MCHLFSVHSRACLVLFFVFFAGVLLARVGEANAQAYELTEGCFEGICIGATAKEVHDKFSSCKRTQLSLSGNAAALVASGDYYVLVCKKSGKLGRYQPVDAQFDRDIGLSKDNYSRSEKGSAYFHVLKGRVAQVYIRLKYPSGLDGQSLCAAIMDRYMGYRLITALGDSSYQACKFRDKYNIPANYQMGVQADNSLPWSVPSADARTIVPALDGEKPNCIVRNNFYQTSWSVFLMVYGFDDIIDELGESAMKDAVP